MKKRCKLKRNNERNNERKAKNKRESFKDVKEMKICKNG